MERYPIQFLCGWGGGGGQGSADKKIDVPIQPATYVVSCFE